MIITIYEDSEMNEPQKIALFLSPSCAARLVLISLGFNWRQINLLLFCVDEIVLTIVTVIISGEVVWCPLLL